LEKYIACYCFVLGCISYGNFYFFSFFIQSFAALFGATGFIFIKYITYNAYDVMHLFTDIKNMGFISDFRQFLFNYADDKLF